MNVLAENRKAGFDYEILETIEAGIELRGFEVKSVKGGRFNIAGSYAVVQNGQVWLINSNIPAYQPKNAPADYDPDRSRRLLLKSEEIRGLIGTIKEKSVSLIPLRAYLKRGLIKVALGIGRAKKKSDKREALKKRTAQREMRRGE